MLFAIACAIYIYIPSDFGDTRLYNVRLNPVYSTYISTSQLSLVNSGQTNNCTHSLFKVYNYVENG